MKHIFAHLSILFMLFPVITNAQMSLPSKAMGKPVIFENEQESWAWEDVVISRRWGKLTQHFWIVYVDREGVKSHKEPSPYGKTERVLSFMDAFFVAKVENGYALLYEEKKSMENPP